MRMATFYTACRILLLVGLDVGEQDGGSVGEEGYDGGLVCVDERLLLLTPLVARQRPHPEPPPPDN